MTAAHLIAFALVVLVASWRSVPLRCQALMIVGAAILSPFTAALAPVPAGIAHVAIDLSGVAAGVAIHKRWPGSNGLLFACLSLLALCATCAMSLMPPHTPEQIYMWKTALNVLFLLTGFSVGGRGFVQLHAHCGVNLGGNRGRAVTDKG
jgi:hypothetical protein